MWTKAKAMRSDAIAAELQQLSTKDLTDPADRRRLNALIEEGEDLQAEHRTHRKGLQMGAYASPSEFGHTDTNPGDLDSATAFKGFAPGMQNRIRPTSMYEMDRTQVGALKQAALQGTSFKVAIGQKGIEHGFLSGVRQKAAVTESGLTPNLLPPIQQLGPGGFWSLPYELTRVANFLPNVAMNGAGIAYFQHTANALEAGYVAEGAAKPDISPTVKEIYVRPAKCAGRMNLTHELVQDAGEAFADNLIADLARSLYNAESNLLLNGTTAANGFNGVNQVTGTLTRAAAIGTTDTDALDVLSKSFTDLRTDFFVPDLVFIHPASLGSIRRLRDTNKRLQLEMIEGPRRIDQTHETETLWGVPVVQTTQQAVGTAAVLSVASGAAVVYVREGLTTFFDPYSQVANNIYQYVAETRIALAVPRPAAICLITGLPTS